MATCFFRNRLKSGKPVYAVTETGARYRIVKIGRKYALTICGQRFTLDHLTFEI